MRTHTTKMDDTTILHVIGCGLLYASQKLTIASVVWSALHLGISAAVEEGTPWITYGIVNDPSQSFEAHLPLSHQISSRDLRKIISIF